MGWTFLHRPKGTTDLDFFRSELWSNPADGARLLDGATYRGAFYGVYEVEAEKAPYLVPFDNGMVRLALVILVKWSNARDGYNFGFKEMDEFSGPYSYDCPARILDQLSPFKDGEEHAKSTEYARKWRDQCRANIAVRSERLKLTDGLPVTLPKPVRFRNGAEHARFIVQRIGRKTRFLADDGLRYILPTCLQAQLTESHS